MELPENKPEYDFRKRNHLLESKIDLYLLLCGISEDDLTDNEADILYSLSKEKEIKDRFKLSKIW